MKWPVFKEPFRYKVDYYRLLVAYELIIWMKVLTFGKHKHHVTMLSTTSYSPFVSGHYVNLTVIDKWPMTVQNERNSNLSDVTFEIFISLQNSVSNGNFKRDVSCVLSSLSRDWQKRNNFILPAWVIRFSPLKLRSC